MYMCVYVCVCARECESYTDQLYVVAERAGVVHSVALTTHQLQEMVEARLKILTVLFYVEIDLTNLWNIKKPETVTFKI